MSDATARAPQRIAAMRERLEAALSPASLAIVDESHRHVGHVGARDGRGHFALRIVAEAFVGKSLLARHRLVYGALGGLLQTDIHALSIEARAPGEPGEPG